MQQLMDYLIGYLDGCDDKESGRLSPSKSYDNPDSLDGWLDAAVETTDKPN
ncbi:hypothetical protein THF5H11_90143 [Vibrio jasicida]|uniref:hypothetical protein n=1 Tax=Vibrio jasicida TaxID=766224 RepID=UPI002893DB13|nr:hypothetical protein THF5H11_90143 [Vibrio jasicida]CAH1607133.1 hypothetical protein THF5G08_310010 [Vibrio jasicida]